MMEEDIMHKLYLLHCPNCCIDNNDKRKFKIQSFSRKRGVILKCKNCNSLMNRKLNKLGNLKMNSQEYTDEQINFIRQEFTNTFITRKELSLEFNNKFGTEKSESSIKYILIKHKIRKGPNFRRVSSYSDEQLSYLRNNYECTDISSDELTQMFNDKFKLCKSVTAIYHILKKNNILKDENYKAATAERQGKRITYMYTQEHADFIKENYTENLYMTRKKILKLFNKEFNLDISIFTLGYIMNRYGLRRAKTGRAVVYSDKVKKFILECVKKGFNKQECKDECEREFAQPFNKVTIGVVANKMGVSFVAKSCKEINQFFEEHDDIEKNIRKLVKKNPDSRWHDILIRDMFIEKYHKGMKAYDIRNFCELKKIKIHHLGQTKKQKRAKLKEHYNKRQKRKALADAYDEEGNYNV